MTNDDNGNSDIKQNGESGRGTRNGHITNDQRELSDVAVELSTTGQHLTEVAGVLWTIAGIEDRIAYLKLAVECQHLRDMLDELAGKLENRALTMS